MSLWLINSLTKKLRANSNLATWVGVDTLSTVRVYLFPAPLLDVLTANKDSYRYIVFRIVGGDPPDWDMPNHRIESWDVRFQFVDKTDGDGTNVLNGYEYVRAIFEPPASGILDDAAYPSMKTMGIRRTSVFEGPDRDPDEDGAIFGEAEWNIQARVA